MDIALQIDGKWAVLPDDTEISVEENSPIFGEGNTYSFPFELNIEENRHIIGNSDQISGESLYKVLDKKDAVLYAGGIPFFYGIISLDDEIEVNDGYIEISLISSTLAFDDMFQDMNCRDVPLKDEIMLGYRYTHADVEFFTKWGESDQSKYGVKGAPLPEHLMLMLDEGGNTTINTDYPYPQKPYCNIRIGFRAEVEEEKEEQSGVNVFDLYGVRWAIDEVLNEGFKDDRSILEAERPNSSPCFYVLYFLDCLFSFKNIKGDYSSINNNGDFNNDLNRLAFVQSGCKYSLGKSEREDISPSVSSPDNPIFVAKLKGSLGNKYPRYAPLAEASYNFFDSHKHVAFLTFYKSKCYATSNNFPDVDVLDVINSLRSAFGIRIDYSPKEGARFFYIRDVLNTNKVLTISAEIIDVHKKENPIRGFKLTYGGDDEDTSYNYNSWNNPIITTSYNEIRNIFNINASNKNLYIDDRNGNAYRIKVNKDAKYEQDAHPSLFEVGMFNSVEIGDCSEENKTEKITIPFTPYVPNDGATRINLYENNDVNDNEQKFYFLVEGTMKAPNVRRAFHYRFPYEDASYSYYRFAHFVLYYTDTQRYANDDESLEAPIVWYGTDDLRYIVPENDASENPILNHDSGFTLGIMRGPGNAAGLETFDSDYDGEGNAKYNVVSKNYAFHSDSVDNFARQFDYDGTGGSSGTADMSNRFSLKLKAEKPVETGSKEYRQCSLPECAERGLFDKFHKEYAHFVTNRKIAILELRMELADLINIDWKSRYTIGGITGFVNKYSYSISNQGISTVTMELYYL